MSLGRTTPILRIFDEAKAKEFYVEFLGFKVDWEHRFEPGLPLYMQVSKDECVLHLPRLPSPPARRPVGGGVGGERRARDGAALSRSEINIIISCCGCMLLY